MTILNSNLKLAPIYGFFEKFGTERLAGLNPAYFEGLSPTEKEEVWNFLSERLARSAERINALYELDSQRAVEAFKNALELPKEDSPYADERKALEECRLLMLGFINSVEPDEKYIALINEFAGSEFKNVRAQFTRFVPAHQVARSAVDVLKGMIFTENESIPLTMAVTKLMLIHGMHFDARDPLYKSIYASLSSGDPKEKRLGMKRLEDRQEPDCA